MQQISNQQPVLHCRSIIWHTAGVTLTLPIGRRLLRRRPQEAWPGFLRRFSGQWQGRTSSALILNAQLRAYKQLM